MCCLLSRGKDAQGAVTRGGGETRDRRIRQATRKLFRKTAEGEGGVRDDAE